MTLKEMLKFLESKESGKCSASHRHYSKGSQAVAPATDCDDRLLKTTHQNQVMSPYSALTASGKFMDRSLHPAPEKNECSAYNHTCKHCNHLHHFEIVCCNKGKPKPSFMTIPSLNRVVFNSLCSLSSPSSYHSSQCPISLDYHTYNQLTDTWIRQAFKPQPFVKVIVTISASDYEAFGLMITKQITSITLSATADTRCESCLAEISAIYHHCMSCKASDLSHHANACCQ